MVPDHFDSSNNTELEKVQHEISPNPPKQPVGNDIPNGGLHAWMQVLGAFFLVFNSW